MLSEKEAELTLEFFKRKNSNAIVLRCLLTSKNLLQNFYSTQEFSKELDCMEKSLFYQASEYFKEVGKK